MRTLIALLLLALCLQGCRSFRQAQTGLPPPTQAPTPACFADETAARGLALSSDAACWVDTDNDGWVDLIAGGALWRNTEGKGFTKVLGLGSVVAADFDNDGFVDLFSWTQLRLYRNQAGTEFAEFPLPDLPPCQSRGACWGDVNRDGYEDLYIGGYEIWDQNVTFPDMILLNEQGKGFRLAWSEVRYRARGVTACDFDQDADLDIYVSNYRLQPNLLWRNDGKGGFADAAAELNAVATAPGFDGGHSIGACWGDFDSDGVIDLFAGNFAHQDDRGDQPKSRFLRNLGPARGCQFEDLGPCGVPYQESYASPSAADYDNDGDLDLFFTTVYAVASFGRKNYPMLFRNDGGFVFTDVTAVARLAELGPTYQNAWGDVDNDGDLDLVTAGKLFVNQGTGNNWLEVRLNGDGQAVTRSAVGAQVRIRLKESVLTRQVEAGTGEGNQNDLALHFGLGRHRGPVTVEVRWLDGTTQVQRRVEPNRLLTVHYANGGKPKPAAPST